MEGRPPLRSLPGRIRFLTASCPSSCPRFPGDTSWLRLRALCQWLRFPGVSAGPTEPHLDSSRDPLRPCVDMGLRKKGRSLTEADPFVVEVSNPLFRRHVLEKVNDTIRVTPLVVVPGDELEEPLLSLEVVLNRRERVVDG